ncbi:MAG: hypothetical protein HY738_02115 [Bacteroidia bacterium]|nr:hypothetical protein [Bacteroidia bacterium]
MKLTILGLVGIFSILFLGCNKDDVETINIHGNVFNTCTGLSFPDVEIQFLESREHMFGDSETKIWKSITNENGNFSFSDMNINFDENYSYGFYIQTKGDLNSCYFYGIGPFEIDKEKMDINHSIGISATFDKCTFYLPENVEIISPDSFIFTLQQRTLHNYEPDRIWQLIWPSSAFGPPYYRWYFGMYPMGLWHITLDKYKEGVHSVVYDSIYLDMCDTASYVIPW